MIARGRLGWVALALASLTACGATRVAATPDAVAAPGCSWAQAEVGPDWWTPSCGDAGYQLTQVTYLTWTAARATLRTRVLITHGNQAGSAYPATAVFHRGNVHLNDTSLSNGTFSVVLQDGTGKEAFASVPVTVN